MDTIWRVGLALVLCSCCLGVQVASANGTDGGHSGIVGNSTSAEQIEGPLTPDNYPYHVQLDDNYELKWNFNSTHIIFHTHVKTNGYIGFGISKNGAMFPSDVIIAWVKDGQVHFADRHAVGQFMPIIDAHQDWHLISGTEQGDYTTITMIRKLDTCDDEDVPITTDTTRIIYSYSPTDPTTDDNIGYHGNRRGTKSVLLLDPPVIGIGKDYLPDDVFSIYFLNNNYSVPGKATTYSCTLWKMPPLDGKHHMIRYEPVITEGHENLIHHIIVYFCTIPLTERQMEHPYECYNNVEVSPYCTSSFVAWAIGGSAFDYPAHVGHSLGTPDDPVYFRMETHYNNVNMRSDLVDNSGIRIILTKQLRQYDAGLLMVGLMINPFQIIPPFMDSFISSGHCHQDCLAEVLGDDGEIYVFSDLLHSHLMGRKLRTRFFRNGTELPPLMKDTTYDFNFQERRMLTEERVIRKGDALVTECDLDSSQRTTVSYGGESTKEEMCLSYILYYPRIPLSSCLSTLTYDMVNPYDIFQQVSSQNWTNEEVRKDFVRTVEESHISNICFGRIPFNFHMTVTSQPNVSIPYVPVDSNCNG